MTFAWTEEMKKLWEFFSKWMIWAVKKDSPQDVKDAEIKFLELLAIEEERQAPLIKKRKQRFLIPTKEMEKLDDVINPWLEWRFVDDAPEEAKRAREKFEELKEIEYERQMRLEGYI